MEHTVIPATDASNKTDIEGACNLSAENCAPGPLFLHPKLCLEMIRFLGNILSNGCIGQVNYQVGTELSRPPSSTIYDKNAACDVSKGVTRDTATILEEISFLKSSDKILMHRELSSPKINSSSHSTRDEHSQFNHFTLMA
ncbi:hypothetical protein V6N13_016026 [Hibiscus sabdariffa]|uniref:Uncharacterized protein n=1 Tax=Hibiscus sabdariffa TaxID=183260 RepID=A0ABR2CXF9_9ROSI